MRRCEVCGTEFTPRNSRHRFDREACRRLAQRAPGTPVFGPLRSALEVSIEALATGPEHRALVEACRTLATTLDGQDYFDDKAWREYRLALKDLREACAGDGPDAFAELLDDLSAEEPDPENTRT